MVKDINDDIRKAHEMAHGKKLLANNAAAIWGHASLAGLRRVQRRVQIMAELIKPTAATKIVELGCGIGIFSEELAKTGAHIVSIDISPDLLEAARARVKANNIEFVEGDCMALETIPAARETDAVVANSVLHHLNVEKALVSMFRVLKPGGRIVFSEPNMVNPQIFLQKNIPWLKRLVGDSPDETAFVRWTLARQLARVGFSEIKVENFDFLHPATPAFAAPSLDKMGKVMEKIPLIKEISGSLLITAKKPLS